MSKLVFNIEAEDARFYRYDIGFSLRSHIANSETSTLLQLASIVTHLKEIFVASYVHVWYGARRMMFQRPTQQFSLASLAERCLLWSYLRQLSWLDLSNFSISVFLKLLSRTIVCWISATYCFSWFMISGIAFEPLLVVQTACIVCNGEKLTIFKHRNMRRRLSSLLEMYARKAWSLCYTALSNCYGIELLGAFLLPVLENLIACLLIYSSMYGGFFSTACSVGFHAFDRKL